MNYIEALKAICVIGVMIGAIFCLGLIIERFYFDQIPAQEHHYLIVTNGGNTTIPAGEWVIGIGGDRDHYLMVINQNESRCKSCHGRAGVALTDILPGSRGKIVIVGSD